MSRPASSTALPVAATSRAWVSRRQGIVRFRQSKPPRSGGLEIGNAFADHRQSVVGGDNWNRHPGRVSPATAAVGSGQFVQRGPPAGLIVDGSPAFGMALAFAQMDSSRRSASIAVSWVDVDADRRGLPSSIYPPDGEHPRNQRKAEIEGEEHGDLATDRKTREPAVQANERRLLRGLCGNAGLFRPEDQGLMS